MLRAVIVDDEPPARRWLRRLLEAEGARVVAEAGSLDEARTVLTQVTADVLFLDVALGDGTGFDLCQPLPPVVFVTGLPDNALRAFDYGAADYLLKPVEQARLARTLARIGESQGQTAKLALRTDRGIRFVDRGEIVMLKAEGDFTRVHLSGGEAVLVGRLLGQFEADLMGSGFLRLTRSIMVNLAMVKGTERLAPGQKALLLRGHREPICMGRHAFRRLRTAMGPLV